MGKLFSGYDPRVHGPMDKRFKASVANSIRNLVAKEKTRRRYLPTTSIAQEFVARLGDPRRPARQVRSGRRLEGDRGLQGAGAEAVG